MRGLDHEVGVIGAGPYGLALATHLRARGVGAAVFGRPMSSWLERMPRGMFLKSEGFASNIADPGVAAHAAAGTAPSSGCRTVTAEIRFRSRLSAATACGFSRRSCRT